MSCNPYGSQGSIVVTPSKPRVTRAWRGSRSRRFSDVTVRDANGKVIAVVENSRAVKPKRATVATPANLAPTPEELRLIALEERRAAFRATLASVHLEAND